MKIILSSDWHFGYKSGSTQHNQDLLDFIDFMIDWSVNNNVDQFAHLGDWFHSRDKIDLLTIDYAIKAVKSLTKRFGKFYQLKGNHDLFLRDSRHISSLEMFRDKVTLIDNTLMTNGMLFVSWLTSGKEYDEVIELTKKHKIKYVLGHFEFQSFKMNDHYEMLHGNSHKELKHVEKIFTGHYHMQQTKDNVQYVGSPFQFDYSDANDFERGFYVLDTDTGKSEFIRYEQVHIMSLDHKDFLENDLSKISNKSMRLVITEELDDEILNKIKVKLETEGYRDTKFVYQINKTEEVLQQETNVDNLESVDDVVKQHLSNMSEVEGVDNNLLLKLYESSN